MSLILDALNRADQERATENQSPSLQTSHSPAPLTNKPIRRWLIEAVIISLAVAAFVYSQWFDQATPTANTPAAERVKQSQPAPSVTPPVSVANQEPAATVVTTTPAAAIESKPLPQQQPNTINNSQPDNAAIASLYQQQPTAPKAPSNTAQTNKPAKAPLSTVDNSQAILLQIPLLSEMPSRFQRSVPTIDYEIHAYSENDRSGFVKLNGAIRKIGAEVEPGLRVVAILKNSLVLSYNDTQFRLAALNSWMNFK